MTAKTLVLLSGGIDSTTALYAVRETAPVALIFDYGQTLAKEVGIARRNALKVGAAPLVVKIDLTWMTSACALLENEALGAPPIPSGRSLDDIRCGGTPSTYVPFRNGIFLAYAVGYAEAHGIESIFLGANGLNSGNYWDDRAEFVNAFEEAVHQGTEPGFSPVILAPFADWKKRDIVRYGRGLGIDYDYTWSCYRNGDEHCGECDSCIQRAEALR